MPDDPRKVEDRLRSGNDRKTSVGGVPFIVDIDFPSTIDWDSRERMQGFQELLHAGN